MYMVSIGGKLVDTKIDEHGNETQVVHKLPTRMSVFNALRMNTSIYKLVVASALQN